MTNPDDLPPPDVMDGAGRMRRIVISLLAGGAGGGIAYAIASRVITEDHDAMHVSARQMDGGTFVIYISLICAVVSLVLALSLQNHLAKRASRDDHVPRAKVR